MVPFRGRLHPARCSFGFTHSWTLSQTSSRTRTISRLKSSLSDQAQHHPVIPPSDPNPATSQQYARTENSGSRASQSRPSHRRPKVVAAGLVLASAVWLGYQAKNNSRDTQSASFIKYKLVAREPVSKSASIFHLASDQRTNTSHADKSIGNLFKSGIWSVQFKQPQLQIVRAYTPLPPSANCTDKQNEGLRFLIRHDLRGEVSSYLHRLPLGADIEVRRPQSVEYPISQDVHRVVFLAGGTGIAPALQVAYAMFEGYAKDGSAPSDGRTLHILWANRSRDDCFGGVSDNHSSSRSRWFSFLGSTRRPISQTPNSGDQGIMVAELEALKQRHPGQITVDYFVDEEGTYIDETTVRDAVRRYLTPPGSTQAQLGLSSERQILISGPDGFVSYLAGPKVWRNGVEEQGPLTNIVSRALTAQPYAITVWKI